MFIATSISTKGGVGKTTCLIGMAMVAAMNGSKVVMVDTDGNEPMKEFQGKGRENGYWSDNVSTVSIFENKSMGSDIPALMDDLEDKGTDFVFIDTKGGEGDFVGIIAQLADIIIVPTALSDVDVNGAEKTIEWFQKLEAEDIDVAPYFVLISQMPPKSKMSKTNQHVLSELQEYFDLFDTVIPLNALIQNMTIYGLFHKVIEELKVATMQSDRLQARNFANALAPFDALLQEAVQKGKN